MNIALWIAQCFLAIVFLGSGVAKATMSKERLIATGQTGVAPFSIRFIRVIAVLELLGVIGVIVPQASGVATVFTPLAAAGLAVIMVGAAISHWSLGERAQALGPNLVLFLISAFVACGRFLGW